MHALEFSETKQIEKFLLSFGPVYTPGYMKKILVLGAGMVGSAMALDLCSRFAVTVADRSEPALSSLKKRNSTIECIQADLREANLLTQLVAPFDLVLSAVPGFMGFKTLNTLLEAGKNVVDISFFPENSLELDALAKAKNLTAIVDCGVAPGVDNLILGFYDTQFKIDTFECLVGGLPQKRAWPWAYKAPFSPVDVIEEYIRPARYVENSHVVIREALSDPELIEFPEVGTLESFNTDGLRSIIFTMGHIPNMKEKTLRYPGHIEYIRVLRSSGFFDENPVIIDGKAIRPIDLSSQLLFKQWKLSANEPEFTIMRVSVSGKKAGQAHKVVYNLYDTYDPESQTSSMARTTGYTATAAVNMFMEGLFDEKGVFPPELVGKNEACFHYIMDYLAQRKVIYRKTED